MSGSDPPSDIEPQKGEPKHRKRKGWSLEKIVFGLIVGYIGYETLQDLSGFFHLFSWLLFLFGLIWTVGTLAVIAGWKSGSHSKEDKRLFIGGEMVFLLFIAFYLVVTDEKYIVVDESASTNGVIPFVRSVVRPDKFFRGQLELTDEAINDLTKSHKSGSQKVEEANKQAKVLTEQLLQSLEKPTQEAAREQETMYREHPESRPLPEEQVAQHYRERADNLERLAQDKRLAAFYDLEYSQNLAALQRTRAAIQQKLGSR